MRNKIVARFADGRIVKGSTADFAPGKDHFHVNPQGASPGTSPVRVPVAELKALIFVRDFLGNPAHQERREFEDDDSTAGRRVRVEFKDGEVLIGTTMGYQPGRPGFFLVPVDPASNMERCYVVAASTAEIRFV